MRLISHEKIAEIRKTLLAEAQMVGKTIEAHAAEQIAQLKANGKYEQARAGVIGFAVGIAFMVLWRLVF